MILSVDISAKEDLSQVDLDVIQSKVSDKASKYGNIYESRSHSSFATNIKNMIL